MKWKGPFDSFLDFNTCQPLMLYLLFFSGVCAGQIHKTHPIMDSPEVFPKIDTEYVDLLNERASDIIKDDVALGNDMIRRAMFLSDSLMYFRGKSNALINLGSSFWILGLFDEALKYYLEALRIIEEHPNKEGLYILYNNIGETYKKNLDYENAYDFLTRSIREAESMKIIPSLVIYNLGELFYLNGDLDSAYVYYVRAKEAAVKENNQRVLSYAHHGFGLWNFSRGNVWHALEDHKQALRIRRAIRDQRAIIASLHEMYKVRFRVSNKTGNKEADDYLLEAEGLARRLNLTDLLLENYRLSASNCITKGEIGRAFDYLDKYIVLKDSLDKLQSKKQYIQLKTSFETDLREKELEVLKSEKEKSDLKLQFQFGLIVAFVVLILFMASLLYLLYLKNRSRKKANTKLSKLNNSILSFNNTISNQAKELELANLKLNEMNKNLEEMVRKRTSVLERQNEMLRKYAFHHAHTLRAPLASIKGLINLLSEEDLDEKNAEIILYLKRCNVDLDQSIQELKSLIDDEELEN